MNQLQRQLKNRLAELPALRHMRQSLRQARLRPVRVLYRSPYDNIFHCCTQKTASQWIRAVFLDPVLYQYTGLDVWPYEHLGLRFAHFDTPLPIDRFIAHLYVDYWTYLAIPKPPQYRTFFVLRDPRDIVVSWYFSARYSHLPFEPIPDLRTDLEKLDLTRGLIYIIDRLEDWGSFQAQKSWLQATAGGEPVHIFRYEELAHDHHGFLRELCSFLEIPIPPRQLAILAQKHAFERHSSGRTQGTEDRLSHYRKGVAGDWRLCFDPLVTAHFAKVTQDLVRVLGYPT
jgi:hypothetical protein